VRIEAPIPNKSAVGIEVPNRSRSTVTLREIISSAEYKKNAGKLLTVALGKDITGNVNCADLSKMPHLLIAGTTGSGKSVCLNCMITSILYNATPSQVKLLMIDPKQVEFTVYNGIPHLLVPVITDARKAAGSLAWAVSEMDNRYKAFSNAGVRDIGGFNKYVQAHPEIEPMPQIVIFIDELNDLMMVSPKEVEDSICRLAQKARAAGMHLVVATQRPSVDVITGVIKANIPSRLSLSVSSQVDSRTILDCIGAENLLGNGDMLFSPVGITKPVRIQGAYLSDEEIERIVTFIKAQENAEYDDDIMSEIERNAAADNSGGKKKSGASVGDEGGNYDALIEDAMDLITLADIASTTAIQRKLGVGYARAGRIMDQLEELGFVSAAEGNKPRKVLVSRAQYLEMKAAGNEPETSDEEYDIFSD
jgi:S-DNA-T family DNA segregation ATPase FtsK/SpoIIIE